MSGSNFIHGVVVVGAMVVLGHAETGLEKLIGFLGVILGAANAAGGTRSRCACWRCLKGSPAKGWSVMDLIQAAYFVVAILFIVGLKRMAHPTTAKSGIVWAGWGMVLAVLATFFWPGMGNFALILLALLLGSVVAWWAAVRVAMTDMPQMVAIYNGMGAGRPPPSPPWNSSRGPLRTRGSWPWPSWAASSGAWPSREASSPSPSSRGS